MKQPRIAEQIAGLERYLSVAQNSILRQDALEVLIWDYLRMGSVRHVQERAQDLLKLDPANPVAQAALEEQGAAPPTVQAKSKNKSHQSQKVIAAQAALIALEQLRKPEGMEPQDFAALRRRVESRLNGTLGLDYVEDEEYQLARTPLQQAVAVDPGNPQYAYALGLALLNSKDPDQQSAFLYLARAVNLTQGTAQGAPIAEFARKQYQKAGGNDGDWSRYLAAAVVPSGTLQSASTAAVAANAPASVTPGKATQAIMASGAGSPNAQQNTSVVAKNTPPPNPASGSGNSGSTRSDAVPRRTPEPVYQPRLQLSAPTAPLSLGIMIQTSLLTNHNRPAIIATLKEIVSHLRADDEAAILVFSNQLDFEQDLTANDALLEQAMSTLRPRPGRALLDGIAFAAGHLKRIGKNSNRVLLVISDGNSSNNKESLPVTSEISGVRIDCVGLNADGDSQRQLLSRLAAYSGGQASFANDPQQFRVAALTMTQQLGLPVR
ncbi:MAG TPA: VWA domain-containing protein [Candidatus Limnocylindrales bacterium]|nr:VWA domain-containing protein [Candidatus Limnocylindrales bacterium]